MSRSLVCLAVLTLAACRSNTPEELSVVSTVAGNGSPGFVNGAITVAELSLPSGVTVDGAGTIYIADSANLRIRKVDSKGNMTTLAGTGTPGHVDGLGTAQFESPVGVAVDANGKLYVTDGNWIRTVAPDGTVATLAGNGMSGSTDGPGASAFFSDPVGVCVDGAGNVYIADTNNNRIRKIDANGNVTTVAGNEIPGDVDGTGGENGAAEFNDPSAVAVDNLGNLYVADTGNHRIRKIDTQGNVTTVSGNGSAGYVDGVGGPTGDAEFDLPSGIAVDLLGNVYVADASNSRIRQIDLNGNVTTLAGNGTSGFSDGQGGPEGAAEFNVPSALAVSGLGNLYVADEGNNRVRLIQH